MRTDIRLLDYKAGKNINGGYSVLKTIHDINDIEDILEVEDILLVFEDDNERDLYFSNFPKYFLGKKGRIYGITKVGSLPKISFNFAAIFFTDKTTGDINESGIKRREKVISKIKQLQLINS